MLSSQLEKCIVYCVRSPRIEYDNTNPSRNETLYAPAVIITACLLHDNKLLVWHKVCNEQQTPEEKKRKVYFIKAYTFGYVSYRDSNER